MYIDYGLTVADLKHYTDNYAYCTFNIHHSRFAQPWMLSSFRTKTELGRHLNMQIGIYYHYCQYKINN